jgi:hypothetical protein
VPRWADLAIAAILGGVLVAARGHVGRLIRTIDQRAGVFSPRGAGLYNAVAPAILRPLDRRVAGLLAVFFVRIRLVRLAAA